MTFYVSHGIYLAMPQINDDYLLAADANLKELDNEKVVMELIYEFLENENEAMIYKINIS